MSSAVDNALDRLSHALSQREIDDALEREIETARLAMMSESDPELRRDFCSCMTQLIAQRSPEQVERMERERGLL